MIDERRRPPQALIPVATGLVWLWCAYSFGIVGFLFSVVPGCLLLSSGVAFLLWPGDIRISEYAAAGAVLGVPIALPIFVVGEPAVALLLIALSIASFVVAGDIAVRNEPRFEGVPEPEPSLALSAQVATDEALLGSMQFTVPLPAGRDWRQIAPEVAEAREFFDAAGWLEKPVDYHREPPPLQDPRLREARTRGIAFEHLSFESAYAPHPDEPGRERWLGYEANRIAHAWVLRHPGPPRPWLMCIHGYQMGWPLVDFAVYAPEYFHRRLGLNLVLPVLPLHGRRKVGRRSGDGFISGPILDTVHAEAQSMWDLRRLLGWVRAQGAPSVGVLGLSLGGYQTALLSALDDGLACAIAGIPVTDFTRILWRHGPPLELQRGALVGLNRAIVDDVYRVVSPLTLAPKIPKNRRYLFGGVADRLVLPDHVRDLWEHWERPRIAWYQGAHVTFRLHPHVHRLVSDALRESGLCD